ncbi:hypothetical protein B0H34DRAFT_215733 [Crassisporium funariophilum]|nr:hypothetical protein B0H34DRAFT_215733 [Crassisporium funariophilum]
MPRRLMKVSRYSTHIARLEPFMTPGNASIRQNVTATPYQPCSTKSLTGLKSLTRPLSSCGFTVLLAQQSARLSHRSWGSVTGRGDAKTLNPSIAYQVVQNIPFERSLVAETVLNDPAIFTCSFESQIREPIVNPLACAFGASPFSSTSPTLILIDGLDEACDSKVQRTIVRIFSSALKFMQHNLPQKVIIASRPEIHIQSAFSTHEIRITTKRLTLDRSYQPDVDIRHFIEASFATIMEEHPLRDSLDRAWPSKPKVNAFVKRSSGQFIYASPGIRYVSPHRHLPQERLKTIFDLPVARKDQPFSELDALYFQIFDSAEHADVILRLWRISQLTSFSQWSPK